MGKREAKTPISMSAEPQLFVRDVTASCEFFRAKLAFEVEFTYGEPPFYAQVRREEVRLNLRFVEEPVFVTGVRERGRLLSATITLSTAAALEELFAEFGSAGVSFQQPMKIEEWGAETFVVADPDGNLILFAAPAR